MPRPLPTPELPADQLRLIRNTIATLRDEERRLEQQTSEAEATAKRITDLAEKYLPDMLDQVGLRRLTLEADATGPAVDAKLENYYRANIAASWPEAKREDAFKWLEENGHGDLIKIEVTVSFSREQAEMAKEFYQSLLLPVQATMRKTVHAGTLKAWLREQVESQRPLPPLELIGGAMGRTVKLKGD
jgi:hypothetical protein